jgi:hypothetical protein
LRAKACLQILQQASENEIKSEQVTNPQFFFLVFK